MSKRCLPLLAPVTGELQAQGLALRAPGPQPRPPPIRENLSSRLSFIFCCGSRHVRTRLLTAVPLHRPPQRYWGEPFPIIFRDGKAIALPDGACSCFAARPLLTSPAGRGAAGSRLFHSRRLRSPASCPAPQTPFPWCFRRRTSSSACGAASQLFRSSFLTPCCSSVCNQRRLTRCH